MLWLSLGKVGKSRGFPLVGFTEVEDCDIPRVFVKVLKVLRSREWDF